MISPLFKFQVVLGANAGEHGDFFATQSFDASALAVGQADICGLEHFAAGSQEGRQRAGCLHRSRVGRRVGDRVILELLVSTWPGCPQHA